jgi:hypothetical protein
MMLQFDRRRTTLWNTSLLVVAAIFAWAVRSLEGLAAASDRWNKLIFPNLGPLSDQAPLFILGVLPGIPFAFVAWRSLRAARAFSTPYRVGIGFLVVVLGLVSFRDLAWMLWFGVSVIYSGGRF